MQPQDVSQQTRDLRDMSTAEIAELVAELGQPSFRTKQIVSWVWEKNVSSFDEMTNLPKSLRTALAERCHLRAL